MTAEVPLQHSREALPVDQALGTNAFAESVKWVHKSRSAGYNDSAALFSCYLLALVPLVDCRPNCHVRQDRMDPAVYRL